MSLHRTFVPSLSSQHGFNLIELMVVISIIAILSAAAWPTYRDYTLKARLSSLLSGLSAIQLVVVMSHEEGIALTDLDAASGDDTQWQTLGLSGAPKANKNMRSVSVKDGQVLVDLGTGIDDSCAQGQLKLVPEWQAQGVSWRTELTRACTSANANRVITQFLSRVGH